MITKFRSVERSQVTESLESQAEHFWSGGGNGVCGEGLDFNRKMWVIKKEMDEIMTMFSCDLTELPIYIIIPFIKELKIYSTDDN